MENSEIATIFTRIADILELQGGDRFRIRAYRTAAMTVQDLSERLEDLARQGADALKGLPGIGESLREKIIELVMTGSLKYYTQLTRQVPSGVLELLNVEGVGPKKVQLLRQTLGIKDLAALEQACRRDKLLTVPGMGRKTQERILQGIEHYRQTRGRLTLAEAWQFAESLLRYLRSHRAFARVEMAGSLRRGKETIGDLDILAIVSDRAQAAAHFLGYSQAQRTLQEGESKCAIVLKSGLQVDLRMIDPPRFGAAWVYFTGSKAHNITIRTLAKRHTWKINEYGIFQTSSNKCLAGATEEDVYRKLKMEWIPPELREDRGEVDAAQQHRLPALVTVDDIKGDLHTHTTATDGHHTIRQMLEAAKARGYAYVAITDHTKSTRVAGGLNDRQMLSHVEAIRKAAKSLRGLTVLCGAEVDILPDGSLDLADATLKELDVVNVSIHSHFSMPRQRMTERIVTAFDNRHATILSHPTGRLIGTRQPYELDLERIIQAAVERRIYLEINAQPHRMDLNDSQCHFAKARGATFVISTDAHSTQDFANIRYGVMTARRGWLEAKDIINTLPRQQLLAAIARR